MTSTSHSLAGTLLPVDLLLITMASIQDGASLTESMFPLVSAQGTTALWLFLVALILLLLLRPWRRRLGLQSLCSVVIRGIALDGMNLLFYLSVRTVPLGIMMALEFTGPLLATILSSRRPLDFLWTGLAVFGIWLLLPLGNSVEPFGLVGAAYALGAGVCWALYILLDQRVGAGHDAQGITLGVLTAAILVVPIGVVHADVDLLDPALIPLVPSITVLSTALPYILEVAVLTRLSTRTLGTPTSIELASGVLSGLLLLGERLSPTQWLAISTIIPASVGTTLSVKSRGAIPALSTKG